MDVVHGLPKHAGITRSHRPFGDDERCTITSTLSIRRLDLCTLIEDDLPPSAIECGRPIHTSVQVCATLHYVASNDSNFHWGMFWASAKCPCLGPTRHITKNYAINEITSAAYVGILHHKNRIKDSRENVTVVDLTCRYNSIYIYSDILGQLSVTFRENPLSYFVMNHANESSRYDLVNGIIFSNVSCHFLTQNHRFLKSTKFSF